MQGLEPITGRSLVRKRSRAELEAAVGFYKPEEEAVVLVKFRCGHLLLARMVLQMRGTVSPANPWDVMVDLFFYRDPEELEDKPAEPEAAAVPGAEAAGYDATGGFGAAPGAAAEPWDESMGAPPAMGGFGGAVPVAGRWNEAPAPSGWDAAAAPVDASGFGSGFDVAPGGC